MRAQSRRDILASMVSVLTTAPQIWASRRSFSQSAFQLATTNWTSAAVLAQTTGGIQNAGRFVGNLDLRAIEGDGPTGQRKMQLLADYKYVDPLGKDWLAPKDTVVDGASIPRAFWTAAGGPWDGPYRHASVIHDFLCQQKSEQWARVHRVFYWAMLGSPRPVPKDQALLFYAAVLTFGPRWNTTAAARAAEVYRFLRADEVPLPPPQQPGVPALPAVPTAERVTERATRSATDQDVKALQEWIRRGAITSAAEVDQVLAAIEVKLPSEP